MDGEKFVEFTSATVDVDVKDYSVRVEKLFPDKQLSKWKRATFAHAAERVSIHLINHTDQETLYSYVIRVYYGNWICA